MNYYNLFCTVKYWVEDVRKEEESPGREIYVYIWFEMTTTELFHIVVNKVRIAMWVVNICWRIGTWRRRDKNKCKLHLRTVQSLTNTCANIYPLDSFAVQLTHSQKPQFISRLSPPVLGYEIFWSLDQYSGSCGRYLMNCISLSVNLSTEPLS